MDRILNEKIDLARRYQGVFLSLKQKDYDTWELDL